MCRRRVVYVGDVQTASRRYVTCSRRPGEVGPKGQMSLVTCHLGGKAHGQKVVHSLSSLSEESSDSVECPRNGFG
jgi:hypothetical protein